MAWMGRCMDVINEPASESDPCLYSGPVVYAVTVDNTVHESLEMLIECASWRPDTFTFAIPHGHQDSTISIKVRHRRTG